MIFAEYLTVEAYSYSMCKLLPDAPQEFHDLFISKIDVFAPTSSMILGTALHSVLLEGKPVPVIPRWVLSADGHRKGKAWTEYRDEHAGETLLTESESEPIKRMMQSVYEHPQARRLLESPGPIEHSIFWTDDASGLPLKMRLDKLAEFGDGRVLVDVKTAAEVDARNFAKAATRLKYHRQVAWYYEGIYAERGTMPEGFCFVAVKNSPPYNCEVYELVESAIELGRQQNRAAIDDLKRRLDANDWHSPTHDRIVPIDIEPWTYK